MDMCYYVHKPQQHFEELKNTLNIIQNIQNR